jgi:hypothetical protein
MRLRAMFNDAMQEACYVWGPLEVLFMIGSKTTFPELRNYAYCAHLDHDTCLVVVAPKMKIASDDRAEAVLKHEIGHAIDFLIPKNEVNATLLERGITPIHTPERRADQIAEFTYNQPIYYDNDTVQSLSRGVRPRPQSLGL